MRSAAIGSDRLVHRLRSSSKTRRFLLRADAVLLLVLRQSRTEGRRHFSDRWRSVLRGVRPMSSFTQRERVELLDDVVDGRADGPKIVRVRIVRSNSMLAVAQSSLDPTVHQCPASQVVVHPQANEPIVTQLCVTARPHADLDCVQGQMYEGSVP